MSLKENEFGTNYECVSLREQQYRDARLRRKLKRDDKLQARTALHRGELLTMMFAFFI